MWQRGWNRRKTMKHKAFRPDRVQDYFLAEWKVLLIVTVTGLVYNVGLLA